MMVSLLLPASWTLQCRSGLFHLVCLLLTALLAFASTTPAVYETDEYIRIQPELASITQKLTNRTVLAYITPWNARGIDVVDEYAEKIDMVSPVWYTVLVDREVVSKGGGNATYVLSGGPPSEKEREWVESKLKNRESRVKIVPRFYLDSWQQNDYADLLSSPSNWNRLSQLITTEVSTKGYHGIVFESAATHLLFEPISLLSSSLKTTDKSLTVVLPPLRTQYSLNGIKLDRMQQSQNTMIKQSIPQLAAVVDYFSIMTYDMSGAGGRASKMEGKDFGKESPLRGAKRGTLREAGPNTSGKWIGENVRLIAEATRDASRAREERRRKQKAEAEAEAELNKEAGEGGDEEVERLKDPSSPFAYDEFGGEEVLDEASVDSQTEERDGEKAPAEQQAEAEQPEDSLSLIKGKLLMGMPMYGYRYPIFWIDKTTGQGIIVSPPLNPDEGKELFSRTSSSSLLPFLRGPAEAVTMDAILTILSDHDGVIIDPKDDGEGWFDYTETVTSESAKGKESQGLKPGDEIYWRMYLPLPSTTQTRLEALEGDNEDVGAGVSLWELGQANGMLLHAL
ncbi:hypothetical protein PHSY_005544 [Pseudozyma hubeiensis SY62]|uniref:Chitinase n=1 Tax=Pseudozyma hubeiensis (strain SY62) TaxID=1305764 RepID=R9P9B4_PSEHS|nr:hypothetical protein PHSY_005544 [Pseudozyma hubeiensis SY62]GAC97956.1 hypothetical protein PHSY_005544 [Pseudozyma hubeiensis SY62]